MNKWKASHMVNALWWAWGRERAKSCCCLIVHGRSCITTSSHSSIISPKLSDTDTYNSLNIPGYFMRLSAFKFLNLHTPLILVRGGLGKTLPFFQVAVHVPSSPRNLTSLAIAPPSKDELDIPPVCSQYHLFSLTGHFNPCSPFLLE